jgi:transcriptional regulator with XRE-family HTH domain
MESDLRDLRVGRVLTQGEVAATVGINPATYNRIERGRQMPRDRLIRRLAEFFTVDPASLRDSLQDTYDRCHVESHDAA